MYFVFMARLILFIALLVHGLIHLTGFLKAFLPARLPQVIIVASKFEGLAWLSAGLLFLVSAFLYLSKNNSWWWIAAAGLIISQVLIVLFWKEARYGTIPNLFFLLVIFVQVAGFRFQQDTIALVRAMQPRTDLRLYHILAKEDIAGLPEPVQRWLNHSGVIGKPVAHAVHLKQRGSMVLKRGDTNWVETQAEQFFNVDEPAFLWSVHMDMGGIIPVKGRDLFKDGKGRMQIRLFSIIDIVNQSDEKISEASLQRFLAEICWFPSAALSQYIQWSPIDGSSARATMTYKNVKADMVFRFSSEGRVVSCSGSRYKSGGPAGQREQWEVRNLAFGIRNEVEIPLRSEATWKLSDGDFTWYRLEVTAIEYTER